MLASQFSQEAIREETTDIRICLDRLEKTVSRLEEMTQFLIKNAKFEGAQEFLSKNESVRERNEASARKATLMQSSLLKYVERFCDLPDPQILVGLVQEHEDLEPFLEALSLPNEPMKYVLDYSGSQKSYAKTRSLVLPSD